MRRKPSSSSSMGTHVIHAEWIGKHARITAAKNPSHAGIAGIVVDETRNTVSIETNKKVRRVPKHGTVFEIDGQEVQGNDVLVAPEERIKIKVS